MKKEITNQSLFAKEGESKIDIFKKKELRKVFHEGEWWFAVKDVLEALTDTTDGNRYSRDLRVKDTELASRWAEITRTLDHDSGGGGVQPTNFINIEGIFRMMQSVSSGKAEDFKKWLAKVGFERIQEMQNPELVLKRARTIYRAKGYDDSWIDARIQNKASRDKLEEEWKNRGIDAKKGEYAFLTDAISIQTFGIKTSKHKAIKHLTTQPLRDNMTPIELTLTTLGEQATTEIAKVRDAKGYFANLQAAKSGGSIAGKARAEIERETGSPVISDKNYLKEDQRKKAELLPPEFREVVKRITAEENPNKENKK
ncbi:MAG: Prophage antirepressor [Candidatus Azambacteria bacterium GW2011_GWB2_46_37]|uniref:Prophage antirepressor n=4 Tax=Candidatus Azamiibacteriota TaxID=1752741 RepID=A0A0G1Q567_9BACT|nr:MAG: Prophage antirepressor [Candidatus Azambacteria bacterium GW2011_GWA2_45_90]KKU34611.1 MAG: Prophage antirepressor [Candidatus Azambacteria bacterium GW2011_GWB1_46_27]KKU39579.1 MAG: Prophage antirepressor [Candidatus Azambacteria bacterium GW2011_GWB2_46_37]KKU40181.1 MAG: Prophage antirepressor [Candidatus Azambacteria bacterium GW2011_GWE2_46_45]